MTIARGLVKEPAPILVVEPTATSIRSGPRTSSSSFESPSGGWPDVRARDPRTRRGPRLPSSDPDAGRHDPNLLTQVPAVFVLMFSPLNFPPDRLPGWLASIQAVLPIQAMGEVIRGTLAGLRSP
jgi:hypothetical protein